MGPAHAGVIVQIVLVESGLVSEEVEAASGAFVYDSQQAARPAWME